MSHRNKRVGLRAAIAAAALLGLLGGASPALASRAFLEPYVTKYEASDGERNHVEISDSEVDWRGATVIDVSDPGASIQAGWGLGHWNGCDEREELTLGRDDRLHWVWCVVEEGRLEVRLLDQNDFFHMGSFSGASVRATVEGGSGTDRLYGGRASDLLFGEADSDELRGDAGADMLSGGDGKDTAVYAERTVAVTVTIPEPAPAPPSGGPPGPVVGEIDLPVAESRPVAAPVIAGNDGASGEGDDVQADVEDVIGGAADDTLIGSSAANGLFGLGGNDYLAGSGGDDHLYGGEGNDDLDGGRGADWLKGGPGTDHLHGGSGADAIDASDGEFDRVDCGNATDRVAADPFDNVDSDCEIRVAELS